MDSKKNIFDDEKFEQLLLQWMDGELDGQLLKDFEADSRFAEYERISSVSSDLKMPLVDETALLRNIKSRINTPIDDIKIIPLWKKIASVASIIIVILCAVVLLDSGISVDSFHSIQVSHALPDGSQVILNSDSNLSYDGDFEEQRILNLEGEAFFEVQKGNAFTVHTDLGDVVVLGTSFNVLSRNDVFTVSCKTGKVEVLVDGLSRILTPGNRIRFDDGVVGLLENINPIKINEWTTGESYFEKTPLVDVILSLSHKYDTNIILPIKYADKLYTGSFIHHDLGIALKMVLEPMAIEYKVIDGHVEIK